MARKNKRQRKKQLIQELDRIGIEDRKAAAKIASDKKRYNQIHNFFEREDIKGFTERQHKILKPLLLGDPKKLKDKIYQFTYDNKRKEIRDNRKIYLKSIGIKDGATLKRLSESTPEFENFKNKYEAEQERKRPLEEVVFWRDKTQEKEHGNNVKEEKNKFRYLSRDLIIEHIKEVMDNDKIWSFHGEIEVHLTKDANTLIKQYTGREFVTGSEEERQIKEQKWELAYRGTAKNEYQLIKAMGGIVSLLYMGAKREGMAMIVRATRQLNPKLADELEKKLGLSIARQKSLFSTKKRK